MKSLWMFSNYLSLTGKISIVVILFVCVFLAIWLSNRSYVEAGIASRYSDFLRGRKTASGERYDPAKLTAAHRTLPLGTYVKVINLENGKEAILKINDRGPYMEGRIIDISRAAARQLGMPERGVAKVKIEKVSGSRNSAHFQK